MEFIWFGLIKGANYRILEIFDCIYGPVTSLYPFINSIVLAGDIPSVLVLAISIAF
jgi:hypothetical protein